MAFMNQEKKKELEAGIKAVLAKFKMKGSLRVRHYSTLVCTITAGELDIIGNAIKVRESKGQPTEFMSQGTLSVNTYWIAEQFTGEVKDFLLELKAAMMVGNHNNSDVMTDYFDVGWYIDIDVGSKKPYKLTKGVAYTGRELEVA